MPTRSVPSCSMTARLSRRGGGGARGAAWSPPRGRPRRLGEPVTPEAEMRVERPAPAIIDRDLVSEPMDTGILVVDALFAVGRGQRELILGDRATGKTAIGVDTLLHRFD